MSEVLQIRASGLPLAFTCPASVIPPKIKIRESGDAANVGTATHEALRPLVEFGDLDWEAVVATAEHHSADVGEVRMLTAMAAKVWRNIAKYFPSAKTETYWTYDGGTYMLTGHTDVDATVDGGTVVRTLDWKTGRKDFDYSEQMKGYCALSMLESGADHASSTIVWVRDKEIERYSMDYDQMQQWLERMERRIVQWDGVYHPGDHCRYCPRDHECEARTAMAKASIAPFATDAKPHDMTQWSNEKFFDMWNKVSVVLHYARKMDSAMRAHVKKHGPIRFSDQEIVSVEERRREINAIEAWDTFVRIGLYNEDLSNVLKVRKKELEKAIGSKAKRGQKAAAVREAFSKIEAAGAMTHSTIEKVVSRRIKEKVEDEDANSETEKK